MSTIAPLKFNDTDQYTHMTVFQTDGVYSANRIHASSLPDGFYRYELSRGQNTRFSTIQEKRSPRHAGDFITKEKLTLDKDGRSILRDDDWTLHTDRAFDFEAFWGCKLSFEKLVSDAERKHDLLMGKNPNGHEISRQDHTQAMPDIT